MLEITDVLNGKKDLTRVDCRIVAIFVRVMNVRDIRRQN